MSKRATPFLLAAMAGLLTACASPQIATRELPKSEPAAVALLNQSQRAHGRTAFTISTPSTTATVSGMAARAGLAAAWRLSTRACRHFCRRSGSCFPLGFCAAPYFKKSKRQKNAQEPERSIS